MTKTRGRGAGWPGNVAVGVPGGSTALDSQPAGGGRQVRRRQVLTGGVAAVAGVLGAQAAAGSAAAASVAVAGVPVIVAPPPSGGDDSAALQAAMPQRGVLQLSAGTYHLSANLAVPNGCDLQGQGGNTADPVTVLQCTTPQAGVTISASGGLTAGFAVDGNGTATVPFLRNGGIGPQVGRTFADLSIFASAQDGLVCLAGQNDAWYQVATTRHARDCLVLDQGYGGTLFSRCEIASGGRYNLRVDDQIGGGAYNTVSDVVFHQCILEYTAASSIGMCLLNGAVQVKFDHTAFYASQPTSGPLLDVASGVDIVIEDALFQSTATSVGGVGVRVAGGTQVIFTGLTHFQNLAQAMYLAGFAQIDVKGLQLFYNCTARYGAAAGVILQSCINNTQTEALVATRQAAGEFTYISRNPAGGFWAYETADGRRTWGSGTDYVGDVSLARRDAGVLGTPPSQMLATGAGPTSARPVAAASNAGAVRVNTDTGQLEASDGTQWLAPTRHIRNYTTGASFTVPDGVTAVHVRAVGAGGGGGGGGTIGSASTATAAAGGAGGGAGAVLALDLFVTPGDTLTVRIGGGGAGGAGGTASTGTSGHAGREGAPGGSTQLTAPDGTVLVDAPGGGGGPGAAGASLTAPVPTTTGGAYGCPDRTTANTSPGCGSFAGHNAVPAPGGVCGGASGAPCTRTHGGTAGTAPTAPGGRATAGRAAAPTAGGQPGAAPSQPGCGGNGGGAGGANAPAGRGGNGSAGTLTISWVT